MVLSNVALQSASAGGNNDSLSPLKKSAVDLVIAIGAQCKSPFMSQTIGQEYFRKAQNGAFAGFLEDPDLDMIRSFLLMSFYMLGACRRNTAFMYLGIAVRASLALGLHSRDSYGDKPDQVR